MAKRLGEEPAFPLSGPLTTHTCFSHVDCVCREQYQTEVKSQIVKEAPPAVLSANTGDVSTTGLCRSRFTVRGPAAPEAAN